MAAEPGRQGPTSLCPRIKCGAGYSVTSPPARGERGLRRLAGGFGVDRGWDLWIVGVGRGELVEEGEDLFGGLALEVGEVIDGLRDQGVQVGRIG